VPEMFNLKGEVMVNPNYKFNFKIARRRWFEKQVFRSPIGWRKMRRVVDGWKFIENIGVAS
jgi:hypothetical protein